MEHNRVAQRITQIHTCRISSRGEDSFWDRRGLSVTLKLTIIIIMIEYNLLKIISTLILLEIATKFLTVAMFVIADWYIIFRAKFASIFMI
jgi:hypothetical protein